MKNKTVFFLFLSAVISLVVIGCGATTSNSDSTNRYSNLFYGSSMDTTPVFNDSSEITASSITASSITAKTSEWGSGNPLYSVYYALREFQSPRDEGVVDRSNLYKLLYDVDTIFSGLVDSAVTISTQEVIPPFGGLPSVICNKAKNVTRNKAAIALTETDEGVNAIISWIWDGETALKAEYGVATLGYDGTSANITVDMSFCVDYNINTPTTDYNMRCHVEGDIAEHYFKFKYIIGTQKIVAEGKSQGDNNVMLFKYNDSLETKYIVVPSDATEAFFYEQLTSPNAIYTDAKELPGSVAEYVNGVDATPFFEDAELYGDTRLLNEGNSREGEIYINFTE